jgi:phage portal protein BeeE
VSKPYDVEYLKGLANNWVVQAYVDTLSQDVASAPWSIQPRDESADIPEDRLADVEREMQQLHPTLSTRDLLEQLSRSVLQLGDGALVKHYTNSGQLEEAVPVDTARMYKAVDKHGFTERYLQASNTRQSVQEFDLDDVVWTEWSYRTDHVYGHGPVEKAAEVVEVLEELGQKEINDLAEGSPPGIVSVKHGDAPAQASDAHEEVKDQWRLKEGERHRQIVTHGDWEYTPLDPGYQKLQFIERNKLWIQSLGSVFKVNAPYAGFDFQEGNRAQNESQTQAYKQRGFKVLLRQIEEAINRQLIWPDFSDELKFSFEDHQSIGEKKRHAEYQKSLADAAEQWDNLGRPVRYHDGMIEIEDGDVDAPEDSGAGGGLFASVDKSEIEKEVAVTTPMDSPPVADDPGGMQQWRSFLEQLDDLGGLIEHEQPGDEYPGGDDLISPQEAMLIHGINETMVEGLLEQYDGINLEVRDGDERDRGQKSDRLTKQQVETLDKHLLEAHKSQIQPKSLDDIEKRVWDDAADVPEYVREKISEVIDTGAIFDTFESLPATTQDKIEGIFEDTLTADDGWNLRELTGNLKDAFPGVDEEQLETVARTESASVMNQAREEGYEDLASTDTNPKFYWQGPDDSRTTDLCEELKEATNPQEGGTPLEMPALKREHEELSNQYYPGLEYREFVGHPNERHTFVRAPDQSLGLELSVSKALPEAVFDDIAESVFVPPDGAAEQAQQALDWIDEHGRDEASGGTQEGLARARQIIDHAENDEPLIGENSDGTPYILEIRNFFARHVDNREIAEEHEGTPWRDNGYFSWLLWGGDPGKQWVDNAAQRLEEEGYLE